MQEMALETDVISVAGRMWTMTQQASHRPVCRHVCYLRKWFLC